MSVAVELLGAVGPIWSVPLFLVWLMWELYCPFPSHTTKLQQFHNDFTERLKQMELIQVAFAEEVTGVDEEIVKEVHDQEDLAVSDLKSD